MSIPQNPDKLLSEPVFSPDEYLEYMKREGRWPEQPAPETMIICYTNDFIERFQREGYAIEQNHIKFGMTKIYWRVLGRDNVALFKSNGIGAPCIIAHLEEMIAWGVKRFISIGTSGGISRDLNFGDVVLCTSAIRDEGTSYHYSDNGNIAYPDRILTEEIEETLSNLDYPFKKGQTWTTDAPYRETKAEVQKMQQQGVLTVEMEASALFTLGKVKQVEVASLLTVSDLLGDLTWKPGFKLEKTAKGRDKIIFATAMTILENF